MSWSFPRPRPTYYAVIITSRLTGEDSAGYGEMARRMSALGAR